MDGLLIRSAWCRSNDKNCITQITTISPLRLAVSILLLCLFSLISIPLTANECLSCNESARSGISGVTPFPQCCGNYPPDPNSPTVCGQVPNTVDADSDTIPDNLESFYDDFDGDGVVEGFDNQFFVHHNNNPLNVPLPFYTIIILGGVFFIVVVITRRDAIPPPTLLRCGVILIVTCGLTNNPLLDAQEGGTFNSIHLQSAAAMSSGGYTMDIAVDAAINPQHYNVWLETWNGDSYDKIDSSINTSLFQHESQSATPQLRLQRCLTTLPNTEAETLFTTNLHPITMTNPPTLTTPVNVNEGGDSTVQWTAINGANTYILEQRHDGSDWTTVYTGDALAWAMHDTTLGQYDYRLRACDTYTSSLGTCGDYSAIGSVIIDTGAHPAPSPASTPLLTSGDLDAMALVGSTQGQFEVDPWGSAQYTLPILTVPGIADVAPELAIAYNSSEGNGSMGLGWSLTGVSAISRCPATVNDGGAQPIQFNDADRFCMDGKRLLVANGLPYGSVGAVYRTEIDTFVTVTTVGGAYGKPDHFIVEGKDGAVRYFGQNPDAKNVALTAAGVPTNDVLYWSINRTEDSLGNGFDYHYSQDSHGHRLTSITYAAGAASIIIEYDTTVRPDPIERYVSGYRFVQNKRITRMTSTHDGTELRRYNLTYATTTPTQPLSRLTELQTCRQTVCWPAATFTWQLGTPTLTQQPWPFYYHNSRLLLLNMFSGGPDMLTYNNIDVALYFNNLRHLTFSSEAFEHISISPNSLGQLSPLIADWDGDGGDELLWHQQGSGDNRLAKNNNMAVYTNPIPPQHMIGQTVIGDWNADGIDDVASVNPANGSHHWYLSNGQGQFTAFHPSLNANTLSHGQIHVVDVNSDGNSDVIWTHCHHVSCINEFDSGSDTGNPLGQPAVGNGQLRVFLNNGALDFTEVIHSIPTSVIANMFYQWGDWNNDGLTDLMAYSQSTGQNHWFISNGLGDFIQTSQSVPVSSVPADHRVQFQLGDWNGDGLTDVLWAFNSSFSNKITTIQRYLQVPGNQFHWLDAPTLNNSQLQRIYVGDLDGNAVDDLIFSYPDNASSETQQFILFYTSNATKPLVTQFNQTLGLSTTVNYQPAINLDSPSIGTVNLTYPTKRFYSDLIQVVTQTQQTGGDVDITENYRYQFILADATRGALGYLAKEKINQATGLRIRTEIEDHYPFINAAKSIEVFTADDQLISRTTNDWQYHTEPTTGAYQPYINESIEETYSLETANQLLAKTVITTSLDRYGNKTQIEKSVFDDANQLVKRTTIDNTFPTDTYSLEKGRVSRSEVTHHRPNSDGSPTDIVRTTAFHYETVGAQKGLLLRQVQEPDDPMLTLTTTYDYDPFGNKIQQSLLAPSIETRRQTWAYEASGRYLLKTKNSYQQAIQSIIARDLYGNPTKTSNINGVVNQFTYDIMGRMVQNASDTGASTSTIMQWCVGVHNSHQCDATAIMRGALYREVETQADGQQRTNYYNKNQQEIQRDIVGFDGRLIRQEQVYDGLGRLVRQSEPYYVGDAVYWSEFDHDVLDRITMITQGDGSQTEQAYDGLRTTIINDLTQARVELRNVLQEPIQVTDALNGHVDYRYDPQGNLRKVTHLGSPTDPQNATTTMTYNTLGHKVAMSDPDKGNWSYEYNPLGELTLQTRATLATTAMTYDALGRLSQRTDTIAGGVVKSDTQWYYNNSTDVITDNGLGALLLVEDSISGYNRTHDYDDFGRPSTTTVQFSISGDAYAMSTTYDQYGRVFQQLDASGDFRGTENRYNTYGYLSDVYESRVVNNQDSWYYQIDAMTARQQVSQTTLANGIVQVTDFEADTGRMDVTRANRLVTNDLVQELQLDWDTIGNLTDKHDLSLDPTNPLSTSYLNLHEHYDYDDLNRLTDTTLNTVSQQTLQYNILGNITQKSDVGTYKYHNECTTSGFGIHAVCETVESDGLHHYSYDANGNLISDSINGITDRTLDYSVFDKPVLMQRGNHQVTFAYGSDRARYRRVDTDNSTGTAQVQETLYLGTVEHITKPSGEVEWKRYIGSTAIVTESTTGSTVRYTLRDHLGSLAMLLDDVGDLVQSLSFDPWGHRRYTHSHQPLSILELLSFDSAETTRGFTNHEMIDSMNIIHMNGRIYDPRLARFLQADKLIPNGLDTQDFNRYSYIRNNPLNDIDPTGYNPLVWIRNQLKSLTSSFFNAVAGLFQNVMSAVAAVQRTISHSSLQVAATRPSQRSRQRRQSANNSNASASNQHNQSGYSDVSNETGNKFAQDVNTNGLDDREFGLEPSRTLASNDNNHAVEIAENLQIDIDTTNSNITLSNITTILNATDKQRELIESDLNDISSTARGREIIDQLVANKINVKIIVNDKGKVDASFKARAILFDPSRKIKIKTSKGIITASSRRILAHELGHATSKNTRFDSGINRMSNIRLNENPIAIELGEPKRIRY